MVIGDGRNDVKQMEDCAVAREEKMKACRTMEKPSSSHCIYLPIAEAKKTINKLVNLFVKISEVGFPRKSKGTDYVLVLKVVDQSYPAPGLSVTFFGENTRKLPDVRSVGDVISLRYVEMKVRNGEVCCLFGKKVSSFALFHGEINVEVTPYQTFPMYYAAEHANNLLLQLRKLPLKHQPDAGFLKCLSLLRNIEVGKTFDIICKILCVHRISRDEWMLFVWDGTDLPPATFQSNLDMEEEQPIPLFLEPVPLSKEILRSFPLEGAVLRIFEDKIFEPINHFRGGDYWVRLCNVTCEIQSGLWRGVVNSSSKVFKLSNEDDKVQYRKRIHTERIATELDRLPLACFPEPSYITVTDHKNVGYATLMDSITNTQVPHWLKCVVRVVAACPWQGEDLRSPLDGCYCVRLTLEDPTARIHAYILGEEGVKFFGYNPTVDQLTGQMSKLLGIKDSDGEERSRASRDPPWIWCFLMCYYVDKKDPWGSRRYRITDTRLVE